MLVYPGVTLLDLVAPHTALAAGCDVHLVSRDGGEVLSDTGIVVAATRTLDEAPVEPDVVFVPGGLGRPGGPGSATVSLEEEVLEFLADRGSRARWVTAVCSGSLVLGAAGLLDGYRAATHWTSMHQLPLFGAVPVWERVVVDRNRVTGGGVTAGLDFGLVLLARLLGEPAARVAQLALEYDPQPPYVGTPARADAATVAATRAFAQHAVDGHERAARELDARGWGRNRGRAGR